MGPQPDHFYDLIFFQDLIDETKLDVDPPGKGTGQISDEFFEGRRSLEGILFEDLQQLVNTYLLERIPVLLA